MTPVQARSAGRELSLRMVYAWELHRFDAHTELLPPDDVTEANPASIQFAQELIAGLKTERVAVDAAIDRRLQNWTMQRLAAVDRAILRLGTYEIIYRSDTPVKVAISEAVELAKRYGSDDKTPRLVNGVLDAVARECRVSELTGSAPPANPL